MLKKIGKIACFLLLVLTPISLQAQGIIKGRVVAKIDTEPLIGVTVILLELKKAVSTDVDGRFYSGCFDTLFLIVHAGFFHFAILHGHGRLNHQCAGI